MRNFSRRGVLTGALQGSAAMVALPGLAGTAFAASAPAARTFPTLSFTERDRRWELARKFMKEQNLSALLGVGSDGGTYRLQPYLANINGGAVLFPLDSPPVRLGVRWDKLNAFDNERLGIEPWIKDTRIVANSAATLAELVEQRGLKGKRVGVMGMGGAGLVAIGSVSYTEGVRIAQALAGVEIVDISVPFGLEILPKSAEELKLIRHTAQAGERAAEALLAECRVGACESDLFAAVINALAREGGDTTTLNMLFTVKPDEVGFVGGPGWFYPMRPPQVLEKGDFVRTEIFANYGGMVCQTHPSISIGEPSTVHRKISEVARRAYEAGLKQIRPGVAFSSVWKAMRQVVLDAGCWASSPLLHSLSPTLLVGELSSGLMEADVDQAIKEPPAPAPRDAILKEGMVLAVEPSAGLGYKNAMVGSTVIVTKDGAEALNSLGTRLLIAKA